MHKRILESIRPLPFVLLITLLLPNIALAAGPTGSYGKEQPPAFERLDNTTPSSNLLGFGYYYTVKAGDDVWLLAIAHGITMETLVEANDLQAPYVIHPGDKLWVPAAPVAVKRQPTPKPSPIPTKPARSAAAPAAIVITIPTAVPPTPMPQPTATAVVSATVAPVEVAAAEVVSATIAPEPTATLEPTPTATPEPTATPLPTPTPQPQPTATPVPAAPQSNMALTLLNLMNEKRVAAGLPALRWSDTLTAAAQAHANDCSRRGWGSHVGSDGSVLRERLIRVGYYPAYKGENWANFSTVQGAFRMWWSEGPGGPHWENIMGPSFTEAGIGIAPSAWGYYFIVDFGRP